MIVINNPDSTKPDVVEFLRNSLKEQRIISTYGSRRKYKIINEEAFRKLFKVFFVIWIYNNFQFEGRSNFCFVKLNKKNTLLLLPSKNIISGYLNENNKSFYKNNIFEGIERTSKDFNAGCIVSNFLNFNLSQFKQKGINNIYHNSKKNCQYCFKKYSKIIANQIIAEQTVGFSLGGYPLLIDNVSSELIRYLLKVCLAEACTKKEISEPLDSLLLAFICIYLGNKKKFGGGKTNCVIRLEGTEIFSNEIDAIIYSQQKKSLIVLELTNLYKDAFKQSFDTRKGKQFPEHFKKTIKNFNLLYHYSNIRNKKLKCIYLTLANFSDEMKKEPEYFILSRNSFIHHINLNNTFEELKLIIEKDELTYKRIDYYFKDFIKKLEKAIK